jgi:hypothetical protein
LIRGRKETQNCKEKAQLPIQVLGWVPIRRKHSVGRAELDKARFIIENGKANLATTNWICQQAIEVHKQVWN